MIFLDRPLLGARPLPHANFSLLSTVDRLSMVNFILTSADNRFFVDILEKKKSDFLSLVNISNMTIV